MKNSLSGVKIIVTGGAGFIGSELTRQLCEIHKAKVIVIDNLVNGVKENLTDLTDKGCDLAIVDIRDTDKVLHLMKGVSIVFHLACLGVRHSIHSPKENHDVNATASLMLLELALKQGVDRFVYCSSSEVYGTARTVPMTELHPTFPMTVYGSAKLAGESYTLSYYRTYGLPTVVVRPFNAYGPRSHHEGDCGEVIPKFMLRCMADRPMVIFGDGSQTRDFTYVSDTAHSLILAATSNNTVGETINIGQGCEITINDLAAEVRKTLSKPDATLEYDDQRQGDVLRLFADTTKARDLLGYTPSISLSDGLRHLRDWYSSLPESPEEMLKKEWVRNWHRQDISALNHRPCEQKPTEHTE
jgi:UDP-glucose 4-epimerase